MGFTYLSSPYRHHENFVVEYRWMKANQIAAGLIRSGFTILCPTLQRHNMANMLPVDDSFWIEQSQCFLEIADGLYVLCLPGWKKDYIVQHEIELATLFDIEVVYLDSNGTPCLEAWEDFASELLGNPKNLVLYP